jgi:hypothetical protein
MDVYGTKPTSPEGEYFRRNVWGWHPLAQLCHDLAPEITAKCEYWHSNDGEGLDADAAGELASVLQEHLATGEVASYIRQRDSWLAGLPDEPCYGCDGVGVIERSREDRVPGACRACGGKGHTTNFKKHYFLHEDDVGEWITFLKSCGGFKIY